jgi:hypothetical protein
MGGACSPRSALGKKAKRRHPIAKLKGNWSPEEDERLRMCAPTHPNLAFDGGINLWQSRWWQLT